MTTDVTGFIAAGRLPDVGVGEEVGVDVDEAGFGDRLTPLRSRSASSSH
jgi:hypothetical protein